MHIVHSLHLCQHSYQLRPFTLLPDYVLDLLSELPGDLILHLVHLPIHHLVTLDNHLATLVGRLATQVDQQKQENGYHIWSNNSKIGESEGCLDGVGRCRKVSDSVWKVSERVWQMAGVGRCHIN